MKRTSFTFEFPPSVWLMRQLHELGRLMEFEGPLLLETLEHLSYELMRHRQASHPDLLAGPVDIVTTEPIREKLRNAMADYYEARYGATAGRMRRTQYPIFDVDEYQFPTVRIAVASCGENDPPALWMLDWPDITKTFDLMTPRNHLLIRGFDGFSNANVI